MPEPASKASGKAASLLSLPCLQQLVVPSTWRTGAAHAAPREQQPVNRSGTLYPPTCPKTQSPTATADRSAAGLSLFSLVAHDSSHHGSQSRTVKSGMAGAQPGEVLRGTDVFSAAPVRGSFLSLLAHGPPIYRGPEPTVKGVRVDAQPGQLHEDAAHEPAWRACLLSLLAADLNSSVHQGGPATGPQTQLHAACQAGPTAPVESHLLLL